MLQNINTVADHATLSIVDGFTSVRNLFKITEVWSNTGVLLAQAHQDNTVEDIALDADIAKLKREKRRAQFTKELKDFKAELNPLV